MIRRGVNITKQLFSSTRRQYGKDFDSLSKAMQQFEQSVDKRKTGKKCVQDSAKEPNLENVLPRENLDYEGCVCTMGQNLPK